MRFPWKSAVLWNAICRKIKTVYILQSCIKMVFTALILRFWLWMNALLNKPKCVMDSSGLYSFLCHQYINWTCEKMMDRHCRKPHFWCIHVAFLWKWFLYEPIKHNLWSPDGLTGNAVCLCSLIGNSQGKNPAWSRGRQWKKGCFVLWQGHFSFK